MRKITASRLAEADMTGVL